MYLDGIKLKENLKLGFRNANPEKDIDTDGSPVERNYTSFVRLSDCKISGKDVRRYYDAKEAPAIIVSHGGTYYGYGLWKMRKSELGVWVKDSNNKLILAHEYMQCTVYFAKDGHVYTGSIRKPISDDILDRQETETMNTTVSPKLAKAMNVKGYDGHVSFIQKGRFINEKGFWFAGKNAGKIDDPWVFIGATEKEANDFIEKLDSFTEEPLQ